MDLLVGDTNADGFVNSADISQTKSQSGQSVTGSNFREDVNADGFINSADISLVKSKSGMRFLRQLLRGRHARARRGTDNSHDGNPVWVDAAGSVAPALM